MSQVFLIQRLKRSSLNFIALLEISSSQKLRPNVKGLKHSL